MMLKPFCAALALLLAGACTPVVTNTPGGAGNAVAPANATVPAAPANATVPPAAGGVPAPGGGGMIGADLTTVRQNSDFFNFFNLAPTGATTAPGVIDFRPTGSDFSSLVDVSVTVDASDRITAMTLTLARSFIDNPATTPFAHDIAKSFLAGAPSLADVQRLSALIADIDPGGPAAAPGYVPQTAAYAVFAGANQTSFAVNLTSTQFAMAPSSEGGAAAMSLSLTAL